MKISKRLSNWFNVLFREGKVEQRPDPNEEALNEPPSPSSRDLPPQDILGDSPRVEFTKEESSPKILTKLERPTKPELDSPKIRRTLPLPNVFSVGSSGSNRMSAETVSEFRELIQRLFDEEQETTTPWIKLGIDLGTSSSKVVWRGESDTFPVCFGDNKNLLESYLMPSVVGIQDGKILAGFDAVGRQNQHIISNFKMCLACASVESSKCSMKKCSLNAGWKVGLFDQALFGEEVKFVNAVFLARLLSTTRQNIINKLAKKFRQTPRPKWTANLAVPEKFIEQSPIAESFRQVFRIAWLMSNVFYRFPDFKNLELVTNCYIAAREIGTESLILEDVTFGCSVYPEVGAEVASIVMNENSDEGLYAFVDIGAGTIDASLFNYFRDGTKPNRPPFATEISKDLGAAHIETYASLISEQSKADRYSVEELRKVKEEYNGMTSQQRLAVERQFKFIKHIALKIAADSKIFLTDVFGKARDEKYPGIVNQTIRLVIGGGGASMKTYQKAAIEAFTSKHATDPRPPEVTILLKPDKFQMSPLPSKEFHRFAVAYGLSYPIEKLPEHILSKDVLMITKPKSPDRTFNALYD